MKWLIIVIVFSSVIFFGSSTNYSVISEGDIPVMTQDSTFDVDAAIADLKAKISGRENDPAEEVFEDIQIMKGLPAGRIIPIMKMGFNRSLGINCTYCHNPNDWASNEKETKEIARQMWAMVGTINNDLLVKIDGLEGPNPVVNCTTCHRGDITPATNLK